MRTAAPGRQAKRRPAELLAGQGFARRGHHRSPRWRRVIASLAHRALPGREWCPRDCLLWAGGEERKEAKVAIEMENLGQAVKSVVPAEKSVR